MNALILVAALAGGHCEGGVCQVSVTAIVAKPALAHRHDVAGRQIAPVRRTWHVIRNHKPLRTWIGSKPLRRLGRRLLSRRCR